MPSNNAQTMGHIAKRRLLLNAGTEFNLGTGSVARKPGIVQGSAQLDWTLKLKKEKSLRSVEIFIYGKGRFGGSVLPIISDLPVVHPWPEAMKPEIRQAIEAICGSPYLKPGEAQSIKTVAMALWEASRMDGQDRLLKDGKTPEVIHAFGVARLVEKMRTKRGLGFEVTLAAVLHDAPEDGVMSMEQARRLVMTATGSQRLANRVAKWVGLMSHTPHLPIDEYAVYLKRVMADPNTRLIKVCDMLDRHTRLQVKELFESEREKTLLQLGPLYQKYDELLGALVEKSAHRAGLLPGG